MPTTLERTTVTHTAQVARALATARQAWPDATSSSVLLVNLILEGEAAVEQREQERRAEQRRRRLSAAGKYSKYYPDGYLDEIRDGWPE